MRNTFPANSIVKIGLLLSKVHISWDFDHNFTHKAKAEIFLNRSLLLHKCLFTNKLSLSQQNLDMISFTTFLFKSTKPWNTFPLISPLHLVWPSYSLVPPEDLGSVSLGEIADDPEEHVSVVDLDMPAEETLTMLTLTININIKSWSPLPCQITLEQKLNSDFKILTLHPNPPYPIPLCISTLGANFIRNVNGRAAQRSSGWRFLTPSLQNTMDGRFIVVSNFKLSSYTEKYCNASQKTESGNHH